MCWGPFTDINCLFLRALVWMNSIRSLFTLTACIFSQHNNLSWISSFTSITCVFLQIPMHLYVSLLQWQSMFVLCCSVFMYHIFHHLRSHIYCLVIILCFHHLHLQFCFAVVWWERRAWKVSPALGHSTSISVDLLDLILKERLASFMNLMCWPLNMINSLAIWEQMIIFSS